VITDQVFIDALGAALKRQKLTASKRRIVIAYALTEPKERRNELIEVAEDVARQVQEATKATKKIKSEFEEQCDFVKWFKAGYPGVVIMSIRNGGSRTPRERVDQMREGLHPGAADLFIPAWKLWIEFKRVKGGILSEEQAIFRDYVRNNGYAWILADGCEAGKTQIIAFYENKA